jgi:hypothetical protein
MHSMGSEPMTPAFELAKIVYALDRAATVTSARNHVGNIYIYIGWSRSVQIMNPTTWSQYSNSHYSKLYVKYGNWFKLDRNR